jgi:L-ascorbate metabolism protein UlaG (beta-lactamase superfamily)
LVSQFIIAFSITATRWTALNRAVVSEANPMRTLLTTALLLSLCAPPSRFVSMLAAAAAPNKQTDVVRTSRGELRLTPLYHGSVMLEFGGKVIHVDPLSQVDYTGLPPADVIVMTHTHIDHLDRSMVDKLKKPATVIVGPPAVIDTLNCAPACSEVEAISDSERKTVMDVGFEGVPMYNVVYGSAAGKPFHHKGVGSGYILTFGDTRVYFSGDTECTPEMKALKNVTIAFLAMSPPRTMSTLDAAACATAFRPSIVYPYHYRNSKPEEFAAAVKGVASIEVRLRKLEGEP